MQPANRAKIRELAAVRENAPQKHLQRETEPAAGVLNWTLAGAGLDGRLGCMLENVPSNCLISLPLPLSVSGCAVVVSPPGEASAGRALSLLVLP